ncbi:MAG: sulfatase-like hydrolase/transferase [Chloroflexi bacterium]|nr:sulfatase-like hydrolase/transferase [Chloroflexota bacterium]
MSKRKRRRKDTRPNILLFITDDHGAWATGAYGNSEVQTPTLDALAKLGTRFTRAYTPSPVCSPARACLLTGKTASQIGIHDWLEEAVPQIGERDWLDGTRTLFDRLSEAGYYTGLSGKWHLGQSHLPPSGTDYHFGLPGWQGAHNGSYTYIRNGKLVDLDGNKSQFITDHAIEFLDAAPADKPFFLSVGYIATHSPYQQSAHDPQQTARYQDCAFDEIPPYQPHDWVKNEGGGKDLNEQDLRDRYIGYYAAASEVDDNITRIIDALSLRDLYKDTIIIYTSDHGCAMGHQGFFGKGNSTRPLNMYDVSLHVPLIVAGANIPSQIAHCNVDHCDTFHTISELAGVDLPADEVFAGKSYAPVLRGQSMIWDNTRYGEYGDLRMIRDYDWKLLWRYPDGPHDLFDLKADPDERHNIYAQQPEIASQLKARLDAYFARHESPQKSGLRGKQLPAHNSANEAWRDGRREARGLQAY